MKGIQCGRKWHAMKVEDLMQALDTSYQGLSEEEAKHRLEEFGPNELRQEKKLSPLRIFLEQFRKILIIILVVAVFLSFLVGEVIDALVILAIIIAIAILGFVQEYRAERALEALKKMAAPTATVIRNGRGREIPARELVPGDVILLTVGDKVPADSRLIESMNLRIDEAHLTGESVPVEKIIMVMPEDVPVADRKNMVFAGTVVTYGHGKAVVVSTGMNTEFGAIARTIQITEKPRTPLEIKVERIGKWLGFIFTIVCMFVALIGIFRGEPFLKMFMLGVALAVAAVPEALPAVITVSLAIGVKRMAKRNAIVRKLSAVETLGCTTVICSDKTGTMTKNEMTVRKIYLNGQIIEVSGVGYEPKGEFRLGNTILKKNDHLALLLKIAVLCNDARLESEDGRWYIVGDPTEGALVVAAAKAEISRDELKRRYPRIGEIPFSSERKRMTTIHLTPEGKRVAYVKGAPEVVLERSTYVYKNGEEVELSKDEKSRILVINEEMASNGLRVLGIAYRELSNLQDDFAEEEVEKNFVFVGLLAMIDPAREEAKHAIQLCNQAGVKTVMITGDHKLTAIAVAKELGMLKSNTGLVLTGAELDKMKEEEFEKIVENVKVYARVSPEHKLRIIRALKKKGHIVAMTGDGVNDAPALKNSDIGVAMGITGTDVTKEASDIILADDNFATIVTAVKEGRGIYDNIKKFLAYLLSANVGEVIIFLLASLFGLPFPLIAAQILWVNLATDGLPALALGVDPAEPDIMLRPPRDPKESPFQGLRTFLIGYPILMVAWVISVFNWVLQSGQGLVKAQTMAFTIIIMLELFQSFSCRSVRYPIIKINPFSNRYLILAVCWEIIMLNALLYVPFFNPLFNTTPLSPFDWIIILLAASTGFTYLEVSKWFQSRRGEKYRRI
ncbi:MAG: calcium-transporting P-type ATPase, PMR1-type [Candidatus Bathyarchaeia archaeon]